ncbi:hypothetical protein LNTAR_09044 [Lentisphaera araneosa HTCC2155]|jgi:hypothetical protein|uniref:Uncharacterized protein n=1 Tax=Lentisphaera araneosa HTCC2155 TaxID=313628 RepID=A6DI50_9BACT|nr:hypothetical protein [Lentisphaera araneosa]EDM28704.1 hypothetical protein LNTAR_09044 [Lentisphaera araneosa HTCC2155]
MKKTLFLLMIFFTLPLFSKDYSFLMKRNSVQILPNGSKSITIYSLNKDGNPIKTVTNVTIKKFLDGSKLFTKTVKIFNLIVEENEEVSESLFDTYVQTSLTRPNPKTLTGDDLRRVPTQVNVSPDGR